VLETPGHTIESISILAFDLHKDPAQPYAVLTGDTLFIGDVGRAALRASLGWSANDLGSHLYHSLHNKLLKLPDSTTCKSASPKFRATAALPSIAPAATARPSPPAFCSNTGSPI
jgi:glyoxylase-like metal-dependent hydrolase (beta-lactamase superfamily II)